MVLNADATAGHRRHPHRALHVPSAESAAAPAKISTNAGTTTIATVVAYAEEVASRQA